MSKEPPASGKNILLAHVRHGKPTEPLSIELKEASLEGEEDFYCISYIPSGNREQVFLDGTPSSIDSTLHDALRVFKSPDLEAIVWAEGLTDVTTNNTSRSLTLATQDEAFGHAEETYLWTGPARPKTGEAYDLLEALAERWRLFAEALRLPENWSQATPQQMRGIIENVQKGIATNTLDLPLLEDDAVVEAANALTSAPYFRHVKAISSIVLAKEPVLSIGLSTMSWKDYCDALNLIAASGGVLPVKCDPVHLQLVASIRIAVRRYRADASSLELLPMLQQSRQTDCEDPRDRVFSILPIISPSKRVSLGHGVPQTPLSIDYSKTQQQLFLDTARYIIGERQDLLLWNDIPPPTKPSRLPGLPSWVPDWSDASAHPTLQLRRSMALRSWENSPCVQRIHKPITTTSTGVLRVQAHVLTTITHVSPTTFSGSNFHNWALETLQMLPPTENLRHEDDYWRTLILDTGPAGSTAPSEYRKAWLNVAAKFAVFKRFGITPEDFAADPGVVRRVAEGNTEEMVAHLLKLAAAAVDSEDFVQLMLKAAGRRFFVTERGFLGMGAWERDAEGGAERDREGNAGESAEASLRAGDVVVVFVGGYFPYVLREDGEGRYRFMGECHLQGCMEAEALGKVGWLGRYWDEVEVRDLEIV